MNSREFARTKFSKVGSKRNALISREFTRVIANSGDLACPLNCGKQNPFNLFEMVVAISSSESTKRTRHLCKAEFFFLFSLLKFLDHVYIE